MWVGWEKRADMMLRYFGNNGQAPAGDDPCRRGGRREGLHFNAWAAHFEK